MGKASLNFAAPEGPDDRREPSGLARFVVYAVCFGALAALASLVVTRRI